MTKHDPTHFQYCQKIVLFRNNNQEVLLAKRQNEADFNGVYSFIGGKMENTDPDILAGLAREIKEEIGSQVRIRICPLISYNVFYLKKDGEAMILPHYYASYVSGKIILSEAEYADYRWVELSGLKELSPKIDNIPEIANRLKNLRETMLESELTEL